jgi:hypothetical protein
MYIINGDNIKTQLHEMTVADLEQALEILNKQDLLPIEKYIDVIELLGASQATLDQMSNDTLFEIIQDFNRARSGEGITALPRTFTDNGILYEAYPEGEEFTIRVKQLAMIERVLSMPGGWYSGILAVLFKRPEHSIREHFEEVNVKNRIKLFRQQPADVFFGYVIRVNESITRNLQTSQPGNEE